MTLKFWSAAVLVAIIAAPAHAETLMARGRYLVDTIGTCGNCHTPKDKRGRPIAAKRFAGGFVIKEEPFDAVAANITPDPETGIGKWTLAQTIRAIREGIRPDGTVIGPPMPIELYRRLSDRDVRAIAVYIRSVKPVRNKVAKSVYRMPLPKSYGPPVNSVPEPDRSNPVAYGRYLAGPAGHCTECHTPLVRGRRDWSRTGVGGQAFRGPWGVSAARNITPHPSDGLGGWSDAQIIRAITRGISKDGSRLTPPMGFAWYARMRRSDLLAIVAYLRSLKPLPTN